LTNRDSLWRLLVVITSRKVVDQARHAGRQKRGGRPAGRDASEEGALDAVPIEMLISQSPTPEFRALMLEECQILLDQLDADDLRSIALWKMEGYTNEEIAARLGCVLRTVERKLELIRRTWSEAGTGG
jgi:DNA-directed RNA polymerase specialized sigma24 family protein